MRGFLRPADSDERCKQSAFFTICVRLFDLLKGFL